MVVECTYVSGVEAYEKEEGGLGIILAVFRPVIEQVLRFVTYPQYYD